MHISYVRPHPRRGGTRLATTTFTLPTRSARSPASPARRPKAAFHPLNELLVNLPVCAAPHDEGERRQLRATYYGAQSEVDDQLGRLFAYSTARGCRRALWSC